MEMVLSCLRVLRHHGVLPSFEAASLATPRMDGMGAAADEMQLAHTFDRFPLKLEQVSSP